MQYCLSYVVGCSNYSPQWLRLKWAELKKNVPNYQQSSFEGWSMFFSFIFHVLLASENLVVHKRNA